MRSDQDALEKFYIQSLIYLEFNIKITNIWCNENSIKGDSLSKDY